MADPTNLQVQPVVSPGTPPPPSKLVTKDLVVGSGTEATTSSTVVVKYVGADFTTGTDFTSGTWTSNQPATFPLSTVVPGFREGIVGMKVGGRREIVIPSSLGYGEKAPRRRSRRTRRSSSSSISKRSSSGSFGNLTKMGEDDESNGPAGDGGTSDSGGQPGWFGVRCVFRWSQPLTYEERITLWEADSLDDAIALAEMDAQAYAERLIPSTSRWRRRTGSARSG